VNLLKDRPLLRRPAVEPVEPVELPEFPLLAADVLVHEPAGDGAPWIVQRNANQYLRVAAGMARLLRAMDGRRTRADLAAVMGAGWTVELVDEGVARALRLELLHDDARPAAKPRRFAFVPPLTFQFTVLSPDRVLARVRPVLAPLANRGAALAVLVLVLLGLGCMAGQATLLRQALSEPVPVTVLALAMGATWAGSALHELSHGAVLSHYGGRPSRMGLMLFYLTPACFCDVSDGWRLPHARQRVRVALAGVAVQAVLASLAAVAAAAAVPLHGGTVLREGLLIFATTNFLAGLFNLVPFVKLDGYLALMAHVDVSHLRDRAMTDGRRAIARALFGGRYARELPQLSWATWFGLACMAFPLYVLGVAFGLWQSLLQGLGTLGAVIASFALCYLAARTWTGARRLVAEARTAGAARWRIVTSLTVLLAAATAALFGISVPYTVAGGFVRQGDQVQFVVLDSADRAAIRPGTEIRLLRGGVLLDGPQGRARIAAGPDRAATAPVSAFTPITGVDAVRLPVRAFPVTVEGALPAAGTGLARAEAGRRSLAGWLYQRYLAPFWG
jgi:putative peptide zinc metalloprotease protein